MLRTEAGRVLQTRGPAMLNDRSPIAVRDLRTSSRKWLGCMPLPLAVNLPYVYHPGQEVRSRGRLSVTWLVTEMEKLTVCRVLLDFQNSFAATLASKVTLNVFIYSLVRYLMVFSATLY